MDFCCIFFFTKFLLKFAPEALIYNKLLLVQIMDDTKEVKILWPKPIIHITVLVKTMVSPTPLCWRYHSLTLRHQYMQHKALQQLYICYTDGPYWIFLCGYLMYSYFSFTLNIQTKISNIHGINFTRLYKTS